MLRLHVLSRKNSHKQQVEEGTYLKMKRFRKIQIIGLDRTHHGQSMSYSCLFLYCRISVDMQILSTTFLEESLSKDQDEKCFLNQYRYSKFYKNFWQHLKTRWNPSVPLQYTVDICTGRPKKVWVWHWLPLSVKKVKIKKFSPGVWIWKNICVSWN